MQQIELRDATAALPALVAQVEAGDEVVLTREGRPVARIVPEVSEPEKAGDLTPKQQARAREGLRRLEALSKELNLGPFDFEEFKRDRDEGRM